MNMKVCKCFLISLILVTLFAYGKSQTAVANHCRDQVPCDNHYQCINPEKWCDEEIDCNDSSDEKYCTTKPWWKLSHSNVNNCSPEKHFVCENGQCVPIATKCDGYKNCKDNSDENDCDETTESYSSSIETDSLIPFPPFKPESPFYEDRLETTTLRPSEGPETTTPYITTTTTPRTDTTTTPRTDTTTTPRTDTTTTHRSTSTSFSTTQPTRASWTPPAVDYYANKMTEDTNQYRAPTYYDNRRTTHSFQRPNENRQYDYNQHRYPDAQILVHYRTTVAPRLNERTQSPVLRAHTVHSQFQTQTSVHAIVPPSASFRAEYGVPRAPRNSQQQTHHQRALRPLSRQNSEPTQYPEAATSRYTILEGCLSYTEQNVSTSGKRNGVLPPFYFKTNYTYQFRNRYSDAVQTAKQWLLDRRDSSYGWGKDTPRALVALSLVSNSFSTNVTDNNLMKKGLEAHLGAQLLNMKNKPLSISRLALYINALLATCQDPRDFLGLDVTEILLDEWRNPRTSFETRMNPLVYLSLCLSNSSVTETELQLLYNLLSPRYHDEKSKDRQILATTALACFEHQEIYNNELKSKVEEVIRDLKRNMRSDGSFGSIYSTALAAQALMSTNSTSWNADRTLNYLANKKWDDGSFGDMLATYYILPVLSGRSLVHLRNTHCDPPPPAEERTLEEILNRPGPKIKLQYTLKVGLPERFSTSIDLQIPRGTNFFCAMLAAQHLNPRFRFQYSSNNGNVDVHTISDIPNDTERGYRWHLYIMNPEDTYLGAEYTGNIYDFHPQDSQELLYWYFR